MSLPPGITSLRDTFSLAVALLDGDATTSLAATDKVQNRCDSDDTLALSAHQTPIGKAVGLLTNLQTQLSRNGMLSKSDVLDDVSTSTVELLGVEYQLARAHLALPTHVFPPSDSDATSNGSHGSHSTNGLSPSILRERNITRAIEFYHFFLKRLEQLGENMLPAATLKEYHAVLDLEDVDESANNKTSRMINPAEIREIKIQRFQRKKAATLERSRLQSQLQRRSRIGLAEDEVIEGSDFESLLRAYFIETLRMHAEESLEEIQSSRGELEMLEMAIKMEHARVQGMDPRMISRQSGRETAAMAQVGMLPRENATAEMRPLQMTQITQHPITGQLEYTKQRVSNGLLMPVQTIQRQDIGDSVFRPSWNQPTMTLAELGERERAAAIQRSEAQTTAEAEAKLRPRRFEQLAKDGMEDNDKLVEASAALDREWDNWKDENPKGSGNKMGERGDRNF